MGNWKLEIELTRDVSSVSFRIAEFRLETGDGKLEIQKEDFINQGE
jgi:hypothetical protein